ncbi:MAG: phage major capsid protein [Brachybacterium tyrofermentans]|uniref:phage major capsid protein n=1 Tax=Brachybacterium tyrofermentans TaxID=47848 RepID=UPI001866A84E|nr:hypothetical protein [Brachybacterium tyrofermentans]
MSFTYPGAPVRVGSDLTTTEIHHLMKTPSLLRKRLGTILDHKFISDYLLAGRFTAEGGAILYETGETIFSADDPEAIAPGGEYPRSVMTSGELATARTTKFGRGTEVTDEAISRLLINPVDSGLRKLANSMIRYIDGVALGVIASKVTQSEAASAAWADAGAIVDTVLAVKAKAEETHVEENFDYSTVVLKPTQFAKVAAALIKSDLVPRESQNFALSGVIPSYLGLTWVTSNHVPFSDPILVDRDQLGGMADEKIQSPGYVGYDGLEVRSDRENSADKYVIQARRITVPVVLEPNAGIRITGTGV